MTTGALQTELQPAPPASGTPQQKHGWRYWLLPHPNVLLVVLLYFVVLTSWIDQLIRYDRSLLAVSYIINRLGLRGIGILGCVLGLLVIDRIDYWIWREHPPRFALIGLFVLRLIVIECAVRLISNPIMGWRLSPTVWIALCLYFAVPAMAAIHWGSPAAYWSAALVWYLALARFLPITSIYRSGWFASATIIDNIVMYSIEMCMIVAVATIASTERRSRTTAERLLNELQISHTQLRQITAEALTLTKERHRLARAIHDTLGHFLTTINVQLEQALAFRPLDPSVADQAAQEAKQLGSEALQEVRRSVAALRIPRPTLWLPPAPAVRRATPSRWRTYRWLLPHSFDIVPALWYLGWLFYFLRDTSAYGIDYLPTTRRWIISAAVIGLLIVDRLAYRIWGEAPRLRISLALVAVRVALMAGIIITANSSHVWYLLFLLPILPHLGFLAAGTRGGLVIAGVILTGVTPLLIYVISDGQSTLADNLFGLGQLSIFLLLVVGTLRTALQDRAHRMEVERVLSDLEAAHTNLKQSSAQALQATEARNQLARDIHDGLGHYLTVINVQIEKAMAFRTRDAAIADQALADAKRLASDALRDVRSALGVLEPAHASFSLTAGLEQLIDNVGERLAADLTISGSEDGFARSSLMVLYRVAQEALTNIQKHAQATQARIELSYAEEHAILTVQDNGRGFDPVQVPHDYPQHYGLQGMRERLEVVGGTFSVVSEPASGTRIDVRVPREALAQRTPDHHGKEPSI